MTVTGIITAIIIGAIIGALGRLVVPGRQPIPIWLTIVVGIVAAFIGTALARAVGISTSTSSIDVESAVTVGRQRAHVESVGGHDRQVRPVLADQAGDGAFARPTGQQHVERIVGSGGVDDVAAAQPGQRTGRRGGKGSPAKCITPSRRWQSSTTSTKSERHRPGPLASTAQVST